MGINAAQFSSLNSATSFTSMVVSPFAGLLMDNYSAGFGLTLGASLLILSQALATQSIQMASYSQMLLSRMVLGPGHEIINMGKNVIFARWFYGQELSFANNICLALCRELTFLSSVVTPVLSGTYSLTTAFGAGVAVCCFSSMALFPIIRSERSY